MILMDGKPLVATHWDGYPSCLGLELLGCNKSLKAVIRIAKRHTIDGADSSILEDLNRERVKELAQKHRLSENEIRSGKRRGSLICAGDHPIGDIQNYGDWAEYQYDIRGKKVMFRPLRGPYPESLEDAPNFKLLSRKSI